MEKPAGIHAMSVALLLAGFSVCVAAPAPINRIDIYDKSDNHLLFVTFDYDAGGVNIGRSIFTSDSTFLRSTTFQPGGTAVATKENSVDFNGNPVFMTAINLPVASKTDFSIVDQFGLSQVGSPMSFQEMSSNNYDVTQNGSVVCKEQYEFGVDGSLNRVSVLDKNGALAWYALVFHQATEVRPLPNPAAGRPFVVAVDLCRIKMRFDLAAEGLVRAEIYSVDGRRVAVPVDKKFTKGSHSVAVDYTSGRPFGNGAYIVRTTINGITMATNRLLLQH